MIDFAVGFAQVIFYLSASIAPILAAYLGWKNHAAIKKVEKATNGMSVQLQDAAFAKGVVQGTAEAVEKIIKKEEPSA